jgi:hypothetical protein
MFVIYVGDSKNVVNRIRTNHCSGNVEGSAMWRHIAEAKGGNVEMGSGHVNLLILFAMKS